MLVDVLGLLGLPREGIALILGVDQLMGMARTVPNVVDDLVAALYLTRKEGLRISPAARLME
ncbi:MAG: cation:dicarboxylase symporter family transporter [Gemmatimonadetes bacterium]|nr:cation:dicarboxylase symporter family transporter [Gemmatimonadota bacterium]